MFFLKFISSSVECLQINIYSPWFTIFCNRFTFNHYHLKKIFKHFFILKIKNRKQIRIWEGCMSAYYLSVDVYLFRVISYFHYNDIFPYPWLYYAELGKQIEVVYCDNKYHKWRGQSKSKSSNPTVFALVHVYIMVIILIINYILYIGWNPSLNYFMKEIFLCQYDIKF